VRRSAEPDKNDMNSKMYVGNLPFNAEDNDIRDLFNNYGTVTEVYLPMDRTTNRPRGFAFVTMGAPSEMQEAIKGLNQKDFMGRPLAINEARPKEDRPAYAGAGGGGGGGGRGRY
jgi:cold-inducible RNA-binding protein